MKVYYLDASAWVKRYYHEAGSAWVCNLFQQVTPLASCSLGFIEVVATLARKAKARELRQAELVRRLRESEADWADLVQVHLTPRVLELARDAAKTYSLRGADAVHLGSALAIRASLPGQDDQVVVVASDTELKEAAIASGLSVLDPEDSGRDSAE
ncbi:MAG: type II toxin-antitoxin system VapC family toxin [Planctomycetes bacterium]|nr:type II toxin-antitoxin system VapC family toxin [Planctomycetota bacterium]